MLIVNGKEILVVSAKTPAELPWAKLGVQLVIESTGLFTDAEKAKGHLAAGAKKVIISAPAKGEDITVVMGVNDDKLNVAQAQHHLQRLLHHELPRADRARAAEGRFRHRGRPDDDRSTPTPRRRRPSMARRRRTGRVAVPRRINIIPSTTGAAKATALVIPEVKGKLTGMSFRVPTPTVSVVDLTVRTVKETSYKAICEAMKKASETYLKGILAYTSDEVVSSDFIHDKHSSIFDAGSGIELNSRSSSSSCRGMTTSGATRTASSI